MLRTLVLLALCGCAAEPCKVIDTANGALLECPGSEVTILNGEDGADGRDAGISARRVFECGYDADKLWESNEGWNVRIFPGPVFYDLGDAWMITCGVTVYAARGEYEDMTNMERMGILPAPSPGQAIVCGAQWLTASFDVATRDVVYRFRDDAATEARHSCRCYGECS